MMTPFEQPKKVQTNAVIIYHVQVKPKAISAFKKIGRYENAVAV